MGEVIVHGRTDLSYSITQLQIFHNSSLAIHKMESSSRISGNGGHFYFRCFDLWLLRDSISYTKQRKQEFVFHGPYLGEMDQHDGYNAADMGAWSHPITVLSLQTKGHKNSISVSIDGTLGKALPMTHSTDDEVRVNANIERFSINFLLDREQMLQDAAFGSTEFTDQYWKSYEPF